MTAATPPGIVPNEFLDGRTQHRPPVTLALLCVMLPLIPPNVVLAGPLRGNGYPAKMIAITMAALVGLGWVLSKRSSNRIALNPGPVILTAYFLIQLVLFGIGASRLGTPLAEANKGRYLLLLLAFAGVGLYTVTRISTSQARSFLLGCLVVGLTLNSAIGVLQIAADINLRFIIKPPGFVLLDAITASGGSLDADMSERFGVPRAVGTNGHAIEFSVLSAITVPLALHFARFAESHRTRLLAGLAAVIAAAGVVVGVSRSGLLALAAALLLYLWTLNVRQLAQGFVAVALAVSAASFFLADSTQALLKTVTNSAEDDSILVRIAAYAKVSEIFHQHPLFGLGPGSTSNLETGHFDNEWLQVIAQGGAVGLLNMIFLCLGAVFGISAALRSAIDGRDRDRAFTMGAMMLGILVSTYTYDMFAYQQVTYIFFILFGLLWSSSRVPDPLPSHRRHSATHRRWKARTQ